MKVKLINVAEYDLREGKADEIPFNTFSNLCVTMKKSVKRNFRQFVFSRALTNSRI